MDYLSSESQLNIDYGRIIPLKRINRILFGTKNEWILDKIVLLNAGLIKYINNEYCLITIKLTNYLDLIKSQQKSLYFPYNYYKYFESETNDHFSHIMHTIDNYINFLDSIGNQFSYLIKHVILGPTFLNAEFVESNDGIICIKFSKKVGKSLFIFLSKEKVEIPSTLCYSNSSNIEQYVKLYEHHKNILLMDEPEQFLISNLEKVTGNFEFSEMAVKSYLIKNEFQTPIKSLCNLISWKNEELMNEFIHFFVNKYSSLVKNDLTNFEGMNKFLLSIDIKYLQQWENKEQINELYYQITHELIRSYELLYSNK